MLAQLVRRFASFRRRLGLFRAYPGGNATRGIKKHTVVFIVPLKAKASSRNWPLVVSNLKATLRSVANSADPHWHVVIAGHDRPNIDWSDRITFLKAPFPLPEAGKGMGDRNRKLRLGGAWLRRVAMGRVYAFFLDADDLVDRDLVGFMRTSKGTAFSCVSGYRLFLDTGVLQAHPRNFRNFCGSSFGSLLEPGELPYAWYEETRRFLDRASHKTVHELAALRGFDVVEVPFPAAVYLVNHSESMEYESKGRKVPRTQPALPDADRRAVLRERFAFTV